ncbi:MAG: ROK family protein [Actinomycetes bacterium]
MTTPAATQDELRRHNIGRLLRLLHVRGATSRSRLTTLTGLNRSTVRALTADLVEAGLVRETTPVGRGRAGRPSIVVEPVSTRTYALALDIGVEHLIAARIGLGGVVLDRREIRRPQVDHDVAKTLQRMESLVEQMLASAPGLSTCVGVGIGVSGVVGARDGVVRFAPNLGWEDVPLGRMLSEHLGGRLPVTVGNDGDLGALAEHVRGAAAGLSDVIYISGEVGVGGGIITGGRPLVGAGGYGGEIGHMCVNPRGRLCRCGRRGCWETEVGEEAVLLATGAPADAELADVLAAHAAGDRRTVAGMRQVGQWMGLGVVNLVNMFNPEMIIFGGSTRVVFALTEEQTREALATALAAPREQVRLEVAALGSDSTVVGAAELAFAPLLDNPLTTPAATPVPMHA